MAECAAVCNPLLLPQSFRPAQNEETVAVLNSDPTGLDGRLSSTPVKPAQTHCQIYNPVSKLLFFGLGVWLILKHWICFMPNYTQWHDESETSFNNNVIFLFFCVFTHSVTLLLVLLSCDVTLTWWSSTFNLLFAPLFLVLIWCSTVALNTHARKHTHWHFKLGKHL